jgi:ABC-type uncharacterized transport system substrate-binding protein
MSRAGLTVSIFVLALGFFTSVQPQPAAGHPHVWIDLKSQLEFDGDGRVIGLQIEWTFDEFYTAFVITESGGPEAMNQKTLTGIGRENLANLQAFDYFTEFLVDGAIRALAAPKTFEIELQDGKLRLRFSVPLERPVIPEDRRINYAIFDPSYYIDIQHSEGGHRLPSNTSPDGCRTVLVAPNPTFEARTLADSLDRLDTARESFGALFAERVRLECN